MLVIFNDQTTVGMVRLFAKEASRAIGEILAEARKRPRKTGGLAAPISADELGPSFPNKRA